MSERSFRRKAPAKHQKNGLPKPNPCPLRRSTTMKRSEPQSKPIKSFYRCHSESIIHTVSLELSEIQIPKTDALQFHQQTCSDIYSKDAKVVVTVTVEGSPGPVRTMVKLEWSVEEIIKVVVDKYREERRNPLLNLDSASSFHLHHSCFSLHNLDKKKTIGEIGSRSFYLRKSSNCSNEISFNSVGRSQTAWSSSSSCFSSTANPEIASPPIIFFPEFIAREFQKIIRTLFKLWKFLDCFQCD
ncbi:hypothetical protein NE237_012796 [Protea cynaroides]|uniref:DUF7054 domain-containing protein n=1 Tax=Protea cynaroides TaxID=273540 RepID=A0A9Q0JZK0_9MAGN|nr:hypothetical protein NE237_012796 [Protea cynaroides]